MAKKIPSKSKDPFAHKIPKEVYLKVAPKLKYQTVKKGEFIETKGKIFFIKSGEIEIIAFTGKEEIVIETLFSGDLFGDFRGNKTPLIRTTPVSRMPNKLCYVPVDDFWNIIDEYPSMGLKLVDYLFTRQEQYQYKLHSYSLPAHEKVLYEINLLKQKLKQSFWGRLFKIPLKISHENLARKTGLNRVTVTRILHKLQKEGLVDFDPKTKEIHLKNTPHS